MSEVLLAAEFDRRRAERVEVDYPLRFGAAEGVARDISAGGLYFETEALVVVGQRLRIEMTVNDVPGGTVTVRARVCRIDEIGEGRYGVGAILEGLSAGSARERTVHPSERMSRARAMYARLRAAE